MATNESWKIGVFRGKKFFVALPFLNGLEYRNVNGQLGSALNVTTSCANTVMISGVTPEKLLLIFCTFVKKIANMGISGLLSKNVLD